MSKTINKTKIPEGWRETNLGEVIKIRKGLTYKSSDYGDETNGLVFINLKCIAKGGGFNNAGIKYYKGKYSEEDLVNSSDLIIANTDLTRAGDVIGAPLFVPNIIDNKMLMSMDVSALDINEKLTNKKFIYYYLLQDDVRQFMRNISSGSTVLHLQVKEVPKFKILLPPLATQNKIAEILVAVDEEIEKIGGVIEKSEKIKDGVIQELFRNQNFKDRNWKVVKLSEISKSLDSKRIPITQSKRTSGQFPYYGATGIVDYISDYIFDEELLLISEDGANLKDRNYPIAFVAIGKYWVNNHAHIQKFDNKYLQSIVCYYLNSINLEPYLTGMAQPKLNKERMNKIPIPIPISEDEQKQITNVLSAVDNKILIYKKIKNNLNQLTKGLMADLLSGNKII